MKKYFLLSAIAVLSFGALESCIDRTTDVVQTTDNDTYSVAYDLKGVNFVKSTTSNNLYGYYKAFTTPIYSSDVVLIYRQSGTTNGNPIWQLLPKTYFLTQGDMDYTFDFTKNDVQLYANGNFDLSVQDATFKNTYLNNQTFRVVIVPASNGGTITGKSANVDYNDYNAVIKYYNIDETKIKSL